jgi:hypothetical protein
MQAHRWVRRSQYGREGDCDQETVVDGLSSIVPLGIALVVIAGKPELLGTPQRWEAASLLLIISAVDLFGGYTFNIALSRRMMDVAA